MSLLTRAPALTKYRVDLRFRSLYMSNRGSSRLLQSQFYKTSTDLNIKLLSRSRKSMASVAVSEVLPTPLDATSEPPTLFDGTTRLYINYGCPFAQRAWITRNAKGAQDKIKLVPLDFSNKPAWYKEKVYPEGKVPALEHNGKIIGESLDLIRYIDANFEGPSLLPEDPAKLKFADEAITKFDTFYKNVFGSFKAEDPVKVAAPEFDFLEEALNKFDDGAYFLGHFSQVDIAFIPLIERFQIFFKAQWNYDITAGRPKLAAFVEAIDKHEAYKHTKCDPEELVQAFRARFL